MNRIIKVLVAGIVAIGLMVMSTGCSTVTTEPDEVAVVYNDGAFTSKSFSNCTDSSQRDWNGPGDNDFIYPAGQRTFSFTGKEGAESGPINVTTGSQEVSISGFLTFTLNTDCKALRKFHERIGNKYKAYKDGGGWQTFLDDYVAVPLDSVLNEAAASIETPEGESAEQNWYRLYTQAEVQNDFAKYVKDNLPKEIEQTLGEEFITVNAVNIKKPNISDELRTSLSKQEEARLENEAQKERNEIARTKYDSLGDCRKSGLSEQACVTIFLAESGSIPFYPVPSGGSINVQPVPAG